MPIISVPPLIILVLSSYATSVAASGGGGGAGLCFNGVQACASDADCGGTCDDRSKLPGIACTAHNECPRGSCLADTVGSCIFPTPIPTTARPTPPPTPFPTPTPTATSATPGPIRDPTAQFDITLVDMGSTPAPADFALAFQEAKTRWEAIIVGELENYQDSTAYGISDWFAGTFNSAYKAAIDDIVIGFAIEYIDGPGAVLGSAGCRYKSGSRCLSGIMR